MDNFGLCGPHGVWEKDIWGEKCPVCCLLDEGQMPHPKPLSIKRDGKRVFWLLRAEYLQQYENMAKAR